MKINYIHIIYMLLILTGHIRKSFDNNDLLNLIKILYSEFKDTLKIYIHTWNRFSNNLSWRIIDINNNIVEKNTINEYFRDLKFLIKHIIIDDDEKIKLIGNIKGNINNYKMPLKGFKNMIYGKNSIINYIYAQKIIDVDEPIINTRFDILDCRTEWRGGYNLENIYNFIKMNINTQFSKNIFMKKDVFLGCDNMYMGNIYTMRILINHLFYNLDEIIEKYKNISNHEFMILLENNNYILWV